MSSFDSDQLFLLFAILFVIYLTTHINRVQSYDDPLIDRIKKDLLKIDNRVSNLTFTASNESFTEDKKHVYLCLKDKEGQYYNYNMLMYVSLHELAHAFSESIDPEHTSKEFKDNFKALLKKGEEAGIYDPKQPLIYDYCPHS